MNADTLAHMAGDPEALDHLANDELPDLLSAVEALRSRIWIRLLRGLRENGKGNEESLEPEHDQLLNVDEAADILSVTPRWLYDRSDDLPFARRLAPRTLRYSERELYQWIVD